MPTFAKWISPFQNERKNVYEEFNILFATGVRLMQLGVTSDFRRKSCPRTTYHVAVALFLGGYSVLEICFGALSGSEFLEAITHVYFGIYFLAFGYQLIYVLVKMNDIHKHRMNMQSFNSTRAIPTVAESILSRKLNVFKKSLTFVVLVWTLACVLYGIGPLVVAAVEFIKTGELGAELAVNCYGIPWWAQLVVVIVDFTVMLVALSQITAMYIISGLLSMEIDTQCAVLCAAMARADIDVSSFKGYIVDHIQVVKNAKWLINMLQSANTPTTFATYFLFALEMLVLTLVERNGTLYIAVAVDIFSMFLHLAAQGWFSTTVTEALKSVSFGAYNSTWYQKNKSNALDVLIISQVAQRENVQKVFLGTLRIERATVLDIFRSSYSFYCLLLILHPK